MTEFQRNPNERGAIWEKGDAWSVKFTDEWLTARRNVSDNEKAPQWRIYRKGTEAHCGAIWERQGSKGPFLSMVIDDVRYSASRVRSDNEKAPQWRIYIETPRPVPVPVEPEPTPTEDDIPF